MTSVAVPLTARLAHSSEAALGQPRAVGADLWWSARRQHSGEATLSFKVWSPGSSELTRVSPFSGPAREVKSALKADFRLDLSLSEIKANQAIIVAHNSRWKARRNCLDCPHLTREYTQSTLLFGVLMPKLQDSSPKRITSSNGDFNHQRSSTFSLQDSHSALLTTGFMTRRCVPCYLSL